MIWHIYYYSNQIILKPHTEMLPWKPLTLIHNKEVIHMLIMYVTNVFFSLCLFFFSSELCRCLIQILNQHFKYFIYIICSLLKSNDNNLHKWDENLHQAPVLWTKRRQLYTSWKFFNQKSKFIFLLLCSEYEIKVSSKNWLKICTSPYALIMNQEKTTLTQFSTMWRYYWGESWL